MRQGNALTAAVDRALYVGELAATGWHRHAAPVLLLGLSGRFSLHWGGGTAECASALVDSRVEHVFDPRGESVALVYLEPDAPEARGLRRLLVGAGGVLLDPALPVRTCSGTQSRLAAFDLGSLLRFSVPVGPALDPRIAASLKVLRAPAWSPLRRTEAAAAAGLSASRFNHLFSAQMGVSFRSYRVWSQLRAAMLACGPGASLTAAAQEGAFFDAAHFSRVFGQTFGMSPSSVLKPLRTVRLL